jgi:two-component system chemotaxis sensor kinase CheA
MKPASIDGPPAPDARRTRVLLVDDDLWVLLSMRRLLERRGYEVVACSAPLDALALIETGHRFDVLITDLSMPLVRGSELLARVAVLDPSLARRAVVITGDLLENAVEELRGAPARLFAKPPDFARLFDAIGELAKDSDSGPNR